MTLVCVVCWRVVIDRPNVTTHVGCWDAEMRMRMHHDATDVHHAS